MKMKTLSGSRWCVIFLLRGEENPKKNDPIFFFVLGSCQLSTNYSCISLIFFSTFWLIPRIGMDVPKDYMILSMCMVFFFGGGCFEHDPQLTATF